MSNSQKGLVIVVSSPSGGGKGTILRRLFENNKNLKFSVSATTRKPRKGEIDGKDYYFISKEEFINDINSGKMLEYAEYCDNFYGTPAGPVIDACENGNDVILEIEVQGGAQIKEKIADAVSIFIVPPSLEVLASRLRGRGTEDEETVNKRLAAAKREIPIASRYDYIVVNDEVESAAEKIEAIIKAEKTRTSRNIEIINTIVKDKG